MGEFADTVVIDGTPERVFALATDLNDAPKWMNGVVRIELLTSGPLRAGSRFRETRRCGKREASCEIEVSVHDGPGGGQRAPYRHTASCRMMGVDASYEFNFAAAGPRSTRVDLHAKVRAVNPLGWLFGPLCFAAMKKNDANQLSRLKHMIESAQGNHDNGE